MQIETGFLIIIDSYKKNINGKKSNLLGPWGTKSRLSNRVFVSDSHTSEGRDSRRNLSISLVFARSVLS